MKIDEVRRTSKADGAGIVIGIIDNGVDGTHPMLRDKIAIEKDFTGEGLHPGKHATHCAAIAAGKEFVCEGKILRGIAPAAHIANIKCLRAESGEGNFPDIIQGVHYLVDSFEELKEGSSGKFSHLILSISLGIGPAVFANPHFNGLIARAMRKGVFCVTAAPGYHMTYWKRFYRPLIVWLCDDTGNPVALSNRMSKQKNERFKVPYAVSDLLTLNADVGPDVLAPGVDIVSAAPGGGITDLSGASMAVANVTGLAALVWQRYPDLLPRQLLESFILQADTEASSIMGLRCTTKRHAVVNAVRVFKNAQHYGRSSQKTRKFTKLKELEDRILNWLENVGPFRIDLNLVGTFFLLLGTLVGIPLFIRLIYDPSAAWPQPKHLIFCGLSSVVGLICLCCDFFRHERTQKLRRKGKKSISKLSVSPNSANSGRTKITS